MSQKKIAVIGDIMLDKYINCKINRYSKENDIIIVPGSVLSSGKLDHPVTIAALKTTEQAKEKIHATNSKFLTIHELLESNHEVGKMKIII